PIFRKELTSNIVNRLVADISVVTNLNGFQELGFGKLNALSEGLKKLLFKVIMRKRNILTYEFRGNKIIRDLYDFYNEGENYKFLPPELKFTLPQPDSCIFKISKKRAVVDYISGMMDTFAVKEWETHCLK
ncbi:TPA: deoxyguanosinetriphosphate triphosphohydrolase, partial [Escherichia coli]